MEDYIQTVSRWLEPVAFVLSHANPYHLVFEGVLLIILLWVFFRSPKKSPSEDKLTSREEEQLLREWKAEPLVPTKIDRLGDALLNVPIVEKATATTITVKGEELTNFAHFNFFGFAGDEKVMAASEEAIRHYGVGSCGPRGFYGSIDVHLKLEQNFAKFMGVEDAILYSSAYAMAASSIPAFSKRSDWLVVDKSCHHALMTGVLLSRSNVKYFDHNNLGQMESLMAEIQRNSGKKLTRRFVVVEAVSQTFGDVLDLKAVLALCRQYKFRIVLDESNSFGVLGKTGHGICEHAGVDPTEIDLNLVSLERAMASSGGLCVGSKIVCGHQRLGGSGYVFSASSPPFTSVASISALDLLETNGPRLVESLRARISQLRALVSDIPGLRLEGSELSPIQHLRLVRPSEDRLQDELFLESLCTTARQHGVFVTRARYVHDEVFFPAPSIRLTVSSCHTESDLNRLSKALHTVAAEKFLLESVNTMSPIKQQ